MHNSCDSVCRFARLLSRRANDRRMTDVKSAKLPGALQSSGSMGGGKQSVGPAVVTTDVEVGAKLCGAIAPHLFGKQHVTAISCPQHDTPTLLPRDHWARPNGMFQSALGHSL